jgi:hypothetical protein
LSESELSEPHLVIIPATTKWCGSLRLQLRLSDTDNFTTLQYIENMKNSAIFLLVHDVGWIGHSLHVISPCQLLSSENKILFSGSPYALITSNPSCRLIKSSSLLFWHAKFRHSCVQKFSFAVVKLMKWTKLKLKINSTIILKYAFSNSSYLWVNLNTLFQALTPAKCAPYLGKAMSQFDYD